jgi:hypothetical protein
MPIDKSILQSWYAAKSSQERACVGIYTSMITAHTTELQIRQSATRTSTLTAMKLLQFAYHLRTSTLMATVFSSFV